MIESDTWISQEQTRSWVKDRARTVLLSGTPFECAPVTVPGLARAPPRAGSFFDTLDEAHSWWELHGMFCTQPTVLETYIPAAMDAQWFVAHAFGVQRNVGGLGCGTFFLLCIPALPPASPDEAATVIRDPTKVVVLQARYSGDAFSAAAVDGSFAAIRGTISMSDYRVFGRVDRATGAIRMEVYARPSVKGNVHVVGGGVGRMVGPGSSRRREPGRAGRPQLLVWVDSDTGKATASLGVLSFGTSVAPSCRAVLYVDDRRFTPRSGAAAACNIPTRGVFSSDGLVLENLLGPLVQLACDAGVQPNAITLSSLVTTAAMLAFHRTGGTVRLAVPFLMMYKWLVDVLDGAVARRCRRSSRLGGVLDTVADFAFIAVAVVMLCTMGPAAGESWRVWALALAVASAPWVALVVGRWSEGQGGVTSAVKDVLSDHATFKNHDSALNTLGWLGSENTLILISTLAVVYILLAVPSLASGAKAAVASAASDGPAAVILGSFAILAAYALLRPDGGDPKPLRYRALAAVLMLVPAAALARGVWCMGRASSGCGATAYTAAGLVAVFAVVFVASEMALGPQTRHST